MKSVLFINRVYPPDEGATGQLLAELAEGLVREGWSVTVLAAGMGNDHRASNIKHRTSKCGDDHKLETRNPKPETRVVVARVRGLPFTRASLWKRALSYLSLYPALLWRAWRLPRHDVVVTLTDPPLHLLLGPLIRCGKRSRLVHWAQDIYPEVAEEIGVLRPGSLAARLLRRLSTWALVRHDAVIAVGRCMKERLLQRGLDPRRITVIPNWAVGSPENPNPNPNPNLQSPASPRAPLRVMYSGNFGLAHPFASIVEAVQILHRQSSPVRFLFSGGGPRLGWVREQLAGYDNVTFQGHLPVEKLQESLASAEVHLACMSDELLGLVVPSKVYGVLAVGRPCVFLGPPQSEAALLVAESRAGVVLPPNDSGPTLARLLASWAGRDAEFARLAAASRAAAHAVATVPAREFSACLGGSKG